MEQSAVGCGGRPSGWDTPYTPASGQNGLAAAYGLTGSVAVLDPSLGRVTLLSSPAQLKLESHSIGLGTNLVAARASADRKTLFALSRGVQPQRTPNDERPQLLLIDGGTTPKVSRTYTLTEPMEQLVLDPQNEWAVVYGGDGVVVNLNELVLVNLTQTGADALSSKTLLSFGGSPRRFTFTTPLSVPGGEPRRFLIVERDSDLVLIDLASPSRDAVTVPLPSTDNGGTASLAQVVYDAASASIAVRVTGSTSVFLLQLAAATTAGEDYSVVTNLVDVGGSPQRSTSCTTHRGYAWWRWSVAARCSWSPRPRPRNRCKCRLRSPAFVALRPSSIRRGTVTLRCCTART